jgi:hypothetical protein
LPWRDRSFTKEACVANETSQKIPDGAYTTAAQLLEKGQPAAAVEQHLVGLGISPEVAKRIVAEQNRASAELATSDGRTEMRAGVAIVGAGLLTGFFIGAVGAVLGIVAGGGIFLRGMYKQRKSR